MKMQVRSIKTNAKRVVLATFILAIFLSAGILTSCKKKEGEVPPDTTKTIAPGFSLVSLDGDTIRLSELKNKVVVLFFLGYSCHFCIESALEIQSMLANQYASNSNVVIIGLDVWDGTHAQVESFKTTTGVTFPLLLNASAIGSAYGTTNDRLVVVDQMGFIRLTGKQAANKDIDAVKGVVNMLL